MLTRLQISLGGGHAGLSLDVSRSDGARLAGRLGPLSLALVMPIVLVLGCQSVGYVTGWYSLDRLMNAPGAPWVWVVTAATFGVLLAAVVLLAARLRITAGRHLASWQLSVTLRLTTLEALALAVSMGLLALFSMHSLADSLACARGVLEAC